MNRSPSEQLTYCTVRIETKYEDGSSGTGTGFIIRFLENITEGLNFPVIITNVHVIKNSIKGELIFCEKDNNGEPIDSKHVIITFDSFEKYWIKHPDKDVDLCCMALSHAVNNATNMGKEFFFTTLNHGHFADDDRRKSFPAIVDIIMVGYPNGLWDSKNNKPIVRKGITASHPSKHFEGRKEFLIDVACYPGSSGSPIFLYNEIGYFDKETQKFKHEGLDLFLLGVLYAGPMYTITGNIKVITIPTNNKPLSISEIPMHLGYVINYKRILELEDHIKYLNNMV
ncbi:trypsin-like peptidase domain-containing protein [Mucilaginibacter mali]|uniref:Trypsin-like peptidase domain-containing protein n=1 Tax=Mucilaginibacter mali TaxID=2740462 RepID=A0A7D4UPA2_9SPHI|nr:serine protease [Mucilaginibacter mali]QKJ30140.1 trypsin-like peptidase domain-containing protein [Mucilaginibacter mali]